MPKLFDIKFPTGCQTLPEGFWAAVDVWLKKPHVANKRLCGVKETEGEDAECGALRFLLRDAGSEPSQDVLSFLTCGASPEHAHGEEKPWCSSVRAFIPKKDCYGAITHKEVILKDFGRQRVSFLPFEEDAEGQVSLKKGNIYQIQLQHEDCEEWSLELHALAPDAWFSDGVAYPRLPWLSTELLPRLVRWAVESRSSEFRSTLSLLPVEKYSVMYQRLKDKYKALVKVWPEVTDPEKFVYEDVAIATYLLVIQTKSGQSISVSKRTRWINACVCVRVCVRVCVCVSVRQVLWSEERAERGLTDPQSFVDLGCGNGLLVHILTNEGHPGRGLDVRRRKIWDLYGPCTQLEEKAITPSESFLFPGTDWLIGNHSDELTPWIPVIAARSSYSCRYFVLPCCFFDFYGKYQRRRCNTSQYKEYIDFIAEVSRVSGFHTEEDCLRIPSTKRVCLLGRSRNYQESGEAQAETLRARYVRSRSGVNDGSADAGTPGSGWGAGFQPRDRVEVVRNCAALPRDFVDGIVLRVANVLLGMTDGGGGGASTDWNQGGSLSVSEVAALLEQQTLALLKKECGGLQTLLRNNHQVFRVEGGRVYIRDWRDRKSSRADARRKPVPPGALKTRRCWFHDHHPQGCRLQAEHCHFAHGPEDLRPSTGPPKKNRNDGLFPSV